MTKHLPLIALAAVMLAACGGSDKNASDKAEQAGNQNELPRHFNQLRALWKKLPRFDSLCPPSIHITFFIKR